VFFPAFEPLAIKIDDPVAYLSDFDDEISVINLADSYAPNAAIVICSGSYKHQLNREIFDGYAVSGHELLDNPLQCYCNFSMKIISVASYFSMKSST